MDELNPATRHRLTGGGAEEDQDFDSQTSDPRADDRPPSGERLIRALHELGVRDPRVVAAFRRVPRARFVPRGSQNEAAIDQPIRIGRGQVTTQPSLVGRMVEALRLQPTDRVLEIGTGFGYQTAILAELAAEVHSVERFPELANAARANLDAAGYRAGVKGSAVVDIAVGDGTLGHPEHAPYGAIVVSAAAHRVPEPLIEQLAHDGRLVMPIGPGGDDEVIAFRREGDELKQLERLCHAFFVRLVGRHGLAET